MKKILPLILLAAAAVFLLTSCDSMLESLFPEDTLGSTEGSNSLTFVVYGQDYSSSLPGLWGYGGIYFSSYAQATIYIAVYNQQNKLVQPAFTGASYSTFTFFNQNFSFAGSRNSPTVTMTGLPDGPYTFKIWYDLNGDGTPSPETSFEGYYLTSYDTTYSSSFYLFGDSTTPIYAQLYEYYPF